MNNSIKDVIDSRLSHMKIDPDVKDNLLDRANNPIRIGSRKRFRKPLIAAAAILLCLLLTVPILGAISEEFNNLLFNINPELAEILMPLDGECISNGIKMEVQAAIADEENCILYLTLHDEEGNRLQDHGYFYDIKSSYWRSAASSYDKDSETIYLKLITQGSFSSNEPQALEFHDLEVNARTISADIDLTQLPESEGVECEYGGYSYNNGETSHAVGGNGLGGTYTTVLEPDVYDIDLPSRLQISNMGFIDGKLHIQTIMKEYDYRLISFLELINKKGDDYTSFELYEMNAEYISACNSYELIEFSDGDTVYTEYVFDMGPEDLEGYSISIQENNIIEGEWTSSIRIDVHESRKINCNVPIADAKVTDLIISPIRLRIEYLGWGRDGRPFDVVLKMKDGEIIKYKIDLMKDGYEKFDTSEGYDFIDGYVGWNVSFTGYTFEILPTTPFDVDNIAEITVDNVVVG